MPRYSAAGRSADTGSTTLPVCALQAHTTVGCRVREIGVFNTTTTAVAICLKRLTTVGTPGSTVTSVSHASDGPASSCLAKNTYTSTGPTLGSALYQTTLGAAAGAGVIWTFGETGLEINPDASNNNGIGVVVATGTGQVVDFYIVWDE